MITKELFARLIKAIEYKPVINTEKVIPKIKKPKVVFYRKSRRRVRFYKYKKVNLGIYALAQSLYKTTDELKSLRGRKIRRKTKAFKARKYKIYYYPRKKMRTKAKCRYIQNKLLKEHRQYRTNTLQIKLKKKRMYKVKLVRKFNKKLKKFIIKKKIVPFNKIIMRKKKINNATYVVFKRMRVKKKSYNQANGSIVLELLKTTELVLGEKSDKKNQNMAIINKYVIIKKNEHAVFNPVDLTDNLRLSLRMLLARLRFKEIIAVNAAKKTTGSQISKPNIFKRMRDTFLKLAVKYYMVTWNKWMGGSLTNFKALGRQHMSLKRNKSSKAKIQDISHPKHLPKLPSMFFSTTNHHYALNESTRIRLPSVQLINTVHLGPSGTIPIAMNMHYLGLRSFTSLLNNAAVFTEHNFKMPYKNKLLRHIIRRGKWIRRLTKKYKARKKTLRVSTGLLLLFVLLIIAVAGIGNQGKTGVKVAKSPKPRKQPVIENTTSPKNVVGAEKTGHPKISGIVEKKTTSDKPFYANTIKTSILDSTNVHTYVPQRRLNSVSAELNPVIPKLYAVDPKTVNLIAPLPNFESRASKRNTSEKPQEIPQQPPELPEQNALNLAEVNQPQQIAQQDIRDMVARLSCVPNLAIAEAVPGLTDQDNYKYALIGSLIYCYKLGIRKEVVYILTIYSVGNAGTNTTYLQELSRHGDFKQSLNFKPFFPKDAWDSLDPDTQKLLENLQPHKITNMVEVATMCCTNQDLEIPLQYNDNQQGTAKMKNSNTLQNNSGNPCPDFFRQLTPPINEVIL